MALVNMSDKKAVMFSSSTTVTMPTGNYTFLGNVPYSFTDNSIDIPSGTIMAVMLNVKAQKGSNFQVFNVDEIVTV